jgi:hypothetical protein
MADKQGKSDRGPDRRAADRRVAAETGYSGPERRKGDRRLHERRST